MTDKAADKKAEQHTPETPAQDMRGENEAVVHPTTEEVQRAIHGENYDAWRDAEDVRMKAFAEAADKTAKANAEALEKTRSLSAQAPKEGYKTRAAQPAGQATPTQK